MDTYRVYGLRLASAVAFPELPADGGQPDVTLRLGDPGSDVTPPGPERSWFVAGPEDTLLVWEDFAAVRIRGGAEIVLDPVPHVEPDWLRAVVLGPIFTLLLQQRGVFPLHASCVALGERAVAFAAASGGGKSTLAGALVERGHLLVADDVTAVSMTPRGIRVAPGPPLLKLDEPSCALLGPSFQGLPRVHSHEEKGARRLAAGFATDDLPLHAVYVLEHGESEAAERLPPQEAFASFLRHGHRPELQEAAIGGPAYMARCTALAAEVPVFRLTRRPGLEHVPATVALIEEHRA